MSMTPTDIIGDDVTLYRADCLDVLPLLPGGSVDAVICDPPYGVNTKSDGNGKLNPWADLCNAAYWYAAWLRECRRVLRPTGSVWSCLNWRSLPTFQKASFDLGWPIESLMVWDKGGEVGPGGPRGLRPSYELVTLWGMPDFAVVNRGLRDLQVFKWGAFKPNDHPAEKPVPLMKFCTQHGSPEGGVVLDPFWGSGTTGLAALQLGRKFVGIEIDEAWYATAVKRLTHATGAGAGQLFAGVGEG